MTRAKVHARFTREQAARAAREADAAECVWWSDRQAAKRSIDALVLQFRMERMGRWIGRIAMILFALALILVALQKPIVRLAS